MLLGIKSLSIMSYQGYVPIINNLGVPVKLRCDLDLERHEDLTIRQKIADIPSTISPVKGENVVAVPNLGPEFMQSFYVGVPSTSEGLEGMDGGAMAAVQFTRINIPSHATEVGQHLDGEHEGIRYAAAERLGNYALVLSADPSQFGPKIQKVLKYKSRQDGVSASASGVLLVSDDGMIRLQKPQDSLDDAADYVNLDIDVLYPTMVMYADPVLNYVSVKLIQSKLSNTMNSGLSAGETRAYFITVIVLLFIIAVIALVMFISEHALFANLRKKFPSIYGSEM
jgi:hypothetical protein